jgi:hypothetical protein
MSFGYSVGDIVLLGQLAWKAYRSCKDAPESFKNVSQEVLSLHAILREIEETFSGQTLLSTRQDNLKKIGDGCRNVLEELQGLVDKYESLGTQQTNLGSNEMGFHRHCGVEIPADFKYSFAHSVLKVWP